MALFAILEGIAALYGGAYIIHCRKKGERLGAFGAWLLSLVSFAMGALLLIYVV